MFIWRWRLMQGSNDDLQHHITEWLVHRLMLAHSMELSQVDVSLHGNRPTVRNDVYSSNWNSGQRSKSRCPVILRIRSHVTNFSGQAPLWGLWIFPVSYAAGVAGSLWLKLRCRPVWFGFCVLWWKVSERLELVALSDSVSIVNSVKHCGPFRWLRKFSNHPTPWSRTTNLSPAYRSHSEKQRQLTLESEWYEILLQPNF
jgi:hypothetical protein